VSALCLQPWITVRGASAVTSLTQDEKGWLDVAGFADAVFTIDVASVTSGGGTISLNIESAPTKDDALFLPVVPAISMKSSATPVSAKTVQTPTMPQLSKWLRWRVSASGATSTWDATFRILGKHSRQSFFVPTLLAGCVLWLRGDLGISPAGGPVSTWSDQSGLGHNASGANHKPTFNATAMNGFPAIQGDGATLYMSTNDILLTITPAVTMCAAVQPSNLDVNAHRILEFDSTNLYELGITSTPNYDFTVKGTSAAGGMPAINTNAIVTGVYAAPTSTLYVNGSPVKTASPTAPAANHDPLFLMASTTGTLLWNGYLGEVIVYNRVLATQELALVHRYLGARYGVSVP
jgi:hypothetical protein